MPEVPWRERRPATSLLVVAGVSGALTALSILVVDQPLARALGQYEPSAIWDRIIEALEWTLGLPVWRFASSVVLVVGMLACVAIARWRPYAPAWMLVAGTHLFGRYLTVKLKDATGRLRPGEWLAKGGDDTFWRDGVAFPSGHVILFASILIPLAVVAPRTRPLLVIVAVVALARIAVNAHYPSDALGAVTLAALVAWALSLGARPLLRTD